MTFDDSAYNQALKYLSSKMYSSEDLRSKLLAKKFEPTEVEEVIAELEKTGLIDDLAYGKTYLRNLISYRSFGYYGIRQKLIQKKLPRDLVDRLLKANLSVDIEETVARRFLEKYTSLRRTKESKVQSLRQKGFRTEVILKVI